MVRKSQKNPFVLPAPDLAHVLRLAQPEWEELRGKKMFLTGGTGFFGKWLLGAMDRANAELGLGLQVTVLSRDPAAFLRQYGEALHFPGLHFKEGHVADFSLPEDRYDYILHAASDTTAFTTEAEEAERSRAIVAGTRRMLDLAQKSGARRFLNISSGAVYGAFAAQL